MKQSQKSTETHDQNAATSNTCKKVEGVQLLILTSFTHFQLLLQRPKAPKSKQKREPKWNPKALTITQNEKASAWENKKKSNPAQSGSVLTFFCIGEALVFRDQSAVKNQRTQTHSQISSKMAKGAWSLQKKQKI